MKMKGISPLLAAVILVALTISVAFIVSSAISGMAQKQSATAEETAKASGAMLQVALDSIVCDNETSIGAKLSMIIRLSGTTTTASGLSIVVKDSSGKLVSNTTDITLSPGVNVEEIYLGENISQGYLQYLAVSTQNPSIHISYDNNEYGEFAYCSNL